MNYEENNAVMLIALKAIMKLEECEQDAFMCAMIETLAEKRNTLPYALIAQYLVQIAEVNFHENKGQ